MKKKNKNEKKITIDNAEKRANEWFVKHGKFFLYAVVGALCIVFISGRFFSSRSAQTQNDFFNAENAFTVFQAGVKENNIEKSKNALKELEIFMKKHPSLHAKYDDSIIQGLIIQRQEIKPLIDRSLQRTKKLTNDYYNDYAKNSLTINSGNYEEGLKKAISLKQKIENANEKEKANLQILFGFNLLRIASLQNDTKNKQKTWDEWNKWKTNYPKAYKHVTIAFQNNKNISFEDYITQVLRTT